MIGLSRGESKRSRSGTRNPDPCEKDSDNGHERLVILIWTLAQKSLRELKQKISSQSKKNFVLEKDVRYLDSRIALLIQNRMAMEEVGEHAIAKAQ